MTPITFAQPKETVEIQKITANDAQRQHLAELGFVVGGRVRLVSRNGGSVILEVRGSRIALGQSMANHILI
ncbi:MAG: FeoA family protein [Anaerovoracaceae bacterium]